MTVRVIDHELLDEFRAARCCEWCKRPTPGGCDPHHLFGRGAGGWSRLDVRINLIGLCRLCHSAHHAGHQPLRCDLLAIVATRESTTQDAIRCAIWRMLALTDHAAGAASMLGQTAGNGPHNARDPGPQDSGPGGFSRKDVLS